MSAAPAAVTTAAPFAVVGTPRQDETWWAAEAVRTGTDCSGVVAAALDLIVAAGIVENPHPETITAWDAPRWREAAAEYHRDRSDRLAVEIEPKRLERLRPLMAIDAASAESRKDGKEPRVPRSRSRSRPCSNCLRLLARFWRGRRSGGIPRRGMSSIVPPPVPIP